MSLMWMNEMDEIDDSTRREIIDKTLDTVLNTTVKDLINTENLVSIWNLKFWDLMKVILNPVLPDDPQLFVDIFYGERHK